MSLPNGAKKVKPIFHFIFHHISGARPDLDEYRRRHECKVEERAGNPPLQRRSGPRPRSGLS